MAAVALVVLSAEQVRAMDPVKFGVKVGIQTQSLDMVKSQFSTPLSAKNTFGYQIGLMSRLSLASVYLQPELVYAHNGFDLEGAATTQRLAVNTLEVPVLVGIKVLFLRFFAGPSFNLLTETKNKSDRPSINSSFFKSAVGYQIGAGVELGGLNVDLRYGGQFKAPVQTISTDFVPWFNVKTKMNAWQINVGYFF